VAQSLIKRARQDDHQSLRISESDFLALEEEAKKRSISLNTLVNQLFLSFVNFDRHFQSLA